MNLRFFKAANIRINGEIFSAWNYFLALQRKQNAIFSVCEGLIIHLN